MQRPCPGILIVRSFLVMAACHLVSEGWTQRPPVREHQVRALFLFHFTQFVKWPDDAFGGTGAPLVIGILGNDPFGNYLDAAVSGQQAGGHPIQVKRFQNVDQVGDCHILFISLVRATDLRPVLSRLHGRHVLTVGVAEHFARDGGMIRLYTEDNKARMQINLEAARAEDLTISAKLLRLADLVGEE